MTIHNAGDGLRIGLSSDTKTADPVGSRFHETDTGDRFVSDGKYYWLTSLGPFSTKKLGRFPGGVEISQGMGILDTLTPGTGTGTIAYAMDNTNGRYLSCPTGTAVGNKSGHRVASTAFTQRAYNFRLRVRFQLVETNLTRAYIGFGDNTEPTGDTPFNSKNGFTVALLSGGTNFILARGDGTAAGDYTTVMAAANTNIHELRIVGRTTTPSFDISLDGSAYLGASTKCPATNTNLTPMWINETNEGTVAKTLRIYDVFFQSDK
jgi:hypothetical protein